MSWFKAYLHKETLLVVSTFILLASLYLCFKSNAVGFGDDLGFLTSITIGYDPATNATNHFLYVNLMSFLTHLVPGSTLFDKAIIFSIVFSLATLVQVFRIACMVTANTTASLAATVMLGLSFTYWRQTEIIEVYTFNNFLFATMLYYMMKDFLCKENKNTLLIGLCFGLALIAHIQNILLVPFFLTYLYFVVIPDYKKVTGSIILAAGIFSSLILIPLIWKTNSILSIFFENDRFHKIATSLDLYIILKGIAKSIGYFFYNFFFLSYFIIDGCFILFKRDKKLFTLMVLASLPIWAFACRYDVNDNYVFFLLPYIVLTIVSAYSFDFWTRKYKLAFYLVPLQVISIPLMYFLIWQTSLHVPQLDSMNKSKAYKGGLRYLLWPGMKDNGDLLKLSKEIYLTGKKPGNFDEFKWNYDFALRYFEITGEFDKNTTTPVSPP